MIRELTEELGIKEDEARNIKSIGKVLIDFNKVGGTFKCITDIFVLKRKKEDLALQDEEVKGIEYYDLEEALNLIRENKTRIPYSQEFEEIFNNLKQELNLKPKNKNIMEK